MLSCGDPRSGGGWPAGVGRGMDAQDVDEGCPGPLVRSGCLVVRAGWCKGVRLYVRGRGGMADAQDLGSCGREAVQVQVLSPAFGWGFSFGSSCSGVFELDFLPQRSLMARRWSLVKAGGWCARRPGVVAVLCPRVFLRGSLGLSGPWVYNLLCVATHLHGFEARATESEPLHQNPSLSRF